MSKMVELMEQTQKEYESRKKQLEQIFADMDAAFQKWKEEVLAFEHSEHCVDDDSLDDDRVCDGKYVWSGENEDDLSRTSEQADGESENSDGPEERRKEDE